MKTPTNVTLESGTPVYLSDQPCSACGCHQAFVFECNCGAVHNDVCYNCGKYVGIEHRPIEVSNAGLDMWWAGRCGEGAKEHTHTWPFKEESRR